MLKLATEGNNGATEAAGAGEAPGSGSGASKGEGVGLGATRLCAMKLMKFPSGDHVTVSGNTHAKSGGITFFRNSPSEL